MANTTDFLIIGGGIIGMATALELQSRAPGAKITVVEKEGRPAAHQSGHNSGVIHAGVYYAPGSMKARFCREGVAGTQDFCAEHNLPYENIGKLIVATSAKEVIRLKELGNRARKNNVKIEDVDRQSLNKLEPHINGLAALYSPTTGITDYQKITEKMAEIFLSRGGNLCFGQTVVKGNEYAGGVSVATNKGDIDAGRVVACAGLYSDRIINSFGQEAGYKVVPFRGEFFRILNQPDDLVRHLIYPVPDPARPFLGVHLTRKIAGGFTVGPNAVLAFKREGYLTRHISVKDLAETLSYQGFWRMLGQHAGSAFSELSASLSRRVYLKRVQKYCSSIKLSDLTPYPAGVRAQAVAMDGKIIDDFLFVKTKHCLHVGNAPSPAATAATPIARYIADTLFS